MTNMMAKPIGQPDPGKLEMSGRQLRQSNSAQKEMSEQQIAMLKRFAYEDSLTSVGNRRLFEEELDRVAVLWDRHRQPVSLMLIDIDRLKQVNDQFGHAAGDELLRRVGMCLQMSVRASDTCARIGGDEFAIIMPMTSDAEAEVVADRVRMLVCVGVANDSIRATASIGIASLGPVSAIIPKDLYRLADRALYRAKALGRNRVETAAPRDFQAEERSLSPMREETRTSLKRRSLLALSAFLVGCFLVYGLGGVLTATSVSDWYPALNKPWWTPPSWVFGPVWTVLYATMAVAAWLIWRTETRSKVVWWIFGSQLTLGLLWSALFFGLQSPGAAMVGILGLLCAIFATIFVFWRKSRFAGAILVPYAVWVSFAAGLNASIWMMNG